MTNNNYVWINSMFVQEITVSAGHLLWMFLKWCPKSCLLMIIINHLIKLKTDFFLNYWTSHWCRKKWLTRSTVWDLPMEQKSDVILVLGHLLKKEWPWSHQGLLTCHCSISSLILLHYIIQITQSKVHNNLLTFDFFITAETWKSIKW